MIEKVYTSCCTLNQMVVQDERDEEGRLVREESFKRIKRFVDRAKAESKLDCSMFRQGGAKALFCMTAPYEKNLEKKLRRLGFDHIRTINRRNGYAPGKVKMWILNW
jgi:hypothetical protein